MNGRIALCNVDVRPNYPEIVQSPLYLIRSKGMNFGLTLLESKQLAIFENDYIGQRLQRNAL